MKIKKTTQGWELIPQTSNEEENMKWLIEEVFQQASQPLSCRDNRDKESSES